MASKEVSRVSESTTLPFGELLRSERERRAWSQAELASRSHVSTRTIVSIENSQQISLRQEVVVRLARALDADPAVWLKLAGHKNIVQEKIEKVIRDSGGFRFRGEIDPAEFFGSLEKRLRPDSPAIVAVSYPSSPGAIHRADVKKILINLFNKGLWLALTCPYPRLSEIEKAKRISLARHYNEVFTDVIELSRELSERMSPERQKQLKVFVPRRPKNPDDIRYVMPLAGLTEYRPTLIQYLAKDKTQEPEYELAAWVTLMQESRDRWIQIYPAQGEPLADNRFRKLLCWRDYFADILTKNDARTWKGWEEKDFRRADWEMVDIVSGC